MIQTRAIPCLLLQQGGLVKTRRFKDPVYLGDPINTVRIFNDKEVDELVVLDIGATRRGTSPDLDVIGTLTAECFMPLAYGGGIRTIEQMRTLLNLGIEKVVINTAFFDDPTLVRRAADMFGSSSVVVSIDVRRDMFGRPRVWAESGRRRTGREPIAVAEAAAASGAGEILLTSIDRDGTFQGYDLPLIKSVADAVGVPVVACGGAASVEDLGRAVLEGGASAAGAGSLFVFQGPHRAVLISYPTHGQLRGVFGDE